MDSNQYDKLMVETLGSNHIKSGTVYYDDAYEKGLIKCLMEYGLSKKYEGELTKNSQGTKMCSIASSSRFCFLASKTIMKEIDEHEKVDVKNGCCHPHYDGYSSKNNTYYEFKCHEFCSESHDELSNSYKPLLLKHFGIAIDDTTKLRFSDFHINLEGNPLINKTNFDFKQLICHILGLLSVTTKANKPRLQYVWIVPSQNDSKELNAFISMVETQVKSIFEQISKINVSTQNEKGLLCDFISFGFDIIPATDIEDFVLKSI